MVRHAPDVLNVQYVQSPASNRPEAPFAPDVKRALTAAVAQELHKIHRGNEVLDWLEAEILVQGVLERDGLEYA